MNASLSKPCRIRKHTEIRDVLLRGTRWDCPFFKLFWIPNQLRGARFAAILSKRIGNAVVRNRVKRRLREAFRTNKSNLPAVDIIVVAKPGCSYKHHQLVSWFLSWKKVIV